MTTLQRIITHPPVHPFSALALILGDWLATGLNIVTFMDAYWPVALASAICAAIAIFFVERLLAGTEQRVALLKAAVAVPLIILPFPFAGSVVGVALLIWALVSWLVPRD